MNSQLFQALVDVDKWMNKEYGEWMHHTSCGLSAPNGQVCLGSKFKLQTFTECGQFLVIEVNLYPGVRLSPSINVGSVQYDLFGAIHVQQASSATSQHFVAFVQVDGVWFRVDDLAGDPSKKRTLKRTCAAQATAADVRNPAKSWLINIAIYVQSTLQPG